MYQKTIYICISWYSKICWFAVKNADVSKTQEVCHVIHIFFYLLSVRYNSAKFHHCRICVTDFREWGPFCSPPPPHRIREQSQKSPSWIELMYLLIELKLYGRDSVCISAIFAWNYLQNLHKIFYFIS